MKVVLLGSNGLLSSSIGIYCNKKKYLLDVFGLNEPSSHSYNRFYNTDFVEGPLDYSLLKDSDVIIYAVGAGIQSNLQESPELIYRLNTEIPVSVCNCLKEAGYRGTFVTLGSYFEIGAVDRNISFDEAGLLGSLYKVPNHYAISKRMLSRFVSSVETPFSFLHFILPTIYGEREGVHRLIPYTLQAIRSGSALSFTSGGQIRQYIYINDVVDILFRSVEKRLESGIYNIAGTEEFSVRELVSLLFCLCGKEVPPGVFGRSVRIDTDMKILRLNGSKLREKIGYLGKTKIAEVYEKYNFE